MKILRRLQTPAASILMGSLFLSGCHRQEPAAATPPAGAASSATSPSAPPGTTVEQRLAVLERQLNQQAEQTKQLLDALKDKQTAPLQPMPAETGASPTPTSVPAAAPLDADEPRLIHGWVARIGPVGRDARIVPSDELGHFDARKDSYRISDYEKESGTRSGVDVGWKGEAYFEAAERGHHTFSINFMRDKVAGDPSGGLACSGSISLEGQPVAQGQVIIRSPSDNSSSSIKSVVGGADLDVGRYRVEFWVACGEMRNDIVTAATSDYALKLATDVIFEVMVKRPSDAGPESAAKAFVIKAPKNRA